MAFAMYSYQRRLHFALPSSMNTCPLTKGRFWLIGIHEIKGIGGVTHTFYEAPIGRHRTRCKPPLAIEKINNATMVVLIQALSWLSMIHAIASVDGRQRYIHLTAKQAKLIY